MDILGIGLGPTQLLLILLVAFFVLGPERLPEVARQIARGIRTLRGYASEVQGQFGGELGELREEFGTIQRDLTSIQGNLRGGLMEIDSSIRSVQGDVHGAVSEVASAVSLAGSSVTDAASTVGTPTAPATIDYAPPPVEPPRQFGTYSPAVAEPAPVEPVDGRLPDFKPGA